jgi:hypothetical protein
VHRYAQTNVQLFVQLRSEGYSTEDRARVRAGYEFAMRLFTGLFLPSGKTFIDHLVGTASILAALHAPVEVVTAGLIHAAYPHGDFGGARKGLTELKRKKVREAVGEEVEDYVARYDRFAWRAERIPRIRDGLGELSLIDRRVLLIRLANELEHELDFGALYFARHLNHQKWHQEYLKLYGPIMAETADNLGFPLLSADMAEVFESVVAAELAVEPHIGGNQHEAFLIVPKSYSKQLGAASYQKLLQARSKYFDNLNHVKRLCGKCFRLANRLFSTAS